MTIAHKPHFCVWKKWLHCRVCLMLLTVLSCSLLQIACGGSSGTSSGGPKGSTCVPPSGAVYSGSQSVTYSFSILHAFTGHANMANVEGGHPFSGLVMDGAGNFYGTTTRDGANYAGTVFKIDPSGKETTLHDFTPTGPDGAHPWGVLAIDTTCNLYGTTTGNSSNWGTVFELDAGGRFTLLHTFNRTDGNSPRGGVIRDAAGNLYGTTQFGGASDFGVLYKIDPNGTFTILHNFMGGADGVAPAGGVVLDPGGNLWGLTQEGGPSNSLCPSGCGVVFKVDPSGNETVVHAFNGLDGADPLTGPSRDAAGNLYGTTSTGGTLQSSNGGGTLFKIDASGAFSVLRNFDGGLNGGAPWSVVADTAGNLYGAAAAGGSGPSCLSVGGCGILFKLDTVGNETVLHNFNFDDGMDPTELIQDAVGNLYGTTMEGGQPVCEQATYTYCGVVFKLSAH